MTLTILGVEGFREVRPGDDLAALVAGAVALEDGDVVVVAQKVVSKAEGALVQVPPGEDRGAFRRRLAREQAVRVLVEAPWTLVVETRHGLVCAQAGIDGSNVEPGVLALLPEDPDASARRLRAGLEARTGLRLAVVVTDTFGRPWRTGQTDVAIGLAGLAATRDERGTTDRFGAALEVTEPAVADELAAAADLVRGGKASGIPVVVVRGLTWTPDDRAAAHDLVRPAATDLFPHGRGTLADHLATPLDLTTSAGPGTTAPPQVATAADAGAPARGPGAGRVPTADDRRRALDAARAGGGGRVAVADADASAGWHVILEAQGDTPDDLVALGAAIATLRAALYDLGFTAHPRPAQDPLRRVVDSG